MGGEVLKAEQKFKPNVGFGRGGGLGARVSALEARMTTVEGHAASAAQDAAKAVANTAELLAIANATRTVAGIIRKHGPKAISFGAGIMTILGIGNPELWKYIGHFFGS
jgi:hypothetical protein